MVRKITYSWTRIFILDGPLIQLAVVYTHPEEPSFFLTNKTGASQGEKLGQMKPLSSKSFNCSFRTYYSSDATLNGGIDIGRIFGMMSIPNSISLSGGT